MTWNEENLKENLRAAEAAKLAPGYRPINDPKTPYPHDDPEHNAGDEEIENNEEEFGCQLTELLEKEKFKIKRSNHYKNEYFGAAKQQQQSDNNDIDDKDDFSDGNGKA